MRTHVVYTNNLFGGAFRGFGAPQVAWAHEATMVRLAKALDLDPLEMRRRNVLDERRRATCTGQRLRRPVLARECLEEAARLAGWEEGSHPLPVALASTPRSFPPSHPKPPGLGRVESP